MFGVILAILVVIVFIYFKYSLSYWKRRGVTGPKPWPIIGNLGPYFLGKLTIGQMFRELYRQYEGHAFIGIFRATKPVLLVRDPELANQILVKEFKSFRNNEIHIDKDVDQIFGKNPFGLKDQEWKDTRQMLTPGLTSGKMKVLYPLMQDINKMFVKFIENHPTATTDGIETRTLTKRLTLDYVAKAAFGIDGKAFEKYDDISDFNKLANGFLNPGSLFAVLLALAQVFPAILNIMSFRFVSKDIEEKLIAIVTEVVKYRNENNIRGNDFLQFLIELSKERKLNESDITGHASTFFIDGYETTSLVLSFLLLNLAQHPEYQEKIRADIRKYEKENNGELTYDAIHEMVWLNACFYESLRCTPIVDNLTKECTEPFKYTPINPEYKNETVKLYPGDVVIIPYSFFSFDKKYFENPHTFFPERMFEKDSFEKGIFIPFGDGPRMCIGQRMGIMQAKMGAVSIIKNFEISVSPKLQQPITYIPFHLLNEVKGGFWIRYKKIKT